MVLLYPRATRVTCWKDGRIYNRAASWVMVHDQNRLTLELYPWNMAQPLVRQMSGPTVALRKNEH